MQPQHVPKPPPRNQPVMSAVAPPTGDDLMMDYMISNFQASSLSTPSALPSREIKQPSHFSLDGQQQQHAAPDAAIDAVGVAGNGGLSGHYEHGFLAAGDGIGADAISAQIDHFRQHEQPSQQRDFQSQQQQQQQFQQRPLSTASVDSAGSQQHQQPLHQQRIVHPNTKLEHFDSFDSATSATTPQLGHTHAKIEPNAATHPASTPSVKPIKPKKTKPASDTPPGPPKPHPCPHPGCTKSYKNPNGLKYHLEHGHPELNPDPMPGGGGGVGSTSDPDGKDGGGKADKDDFKPFMCRHEGCDKLYKNLNGLKYHLVHAHGFAEADTKDVLSRAKADAREAGWIPPSLGRGRGRSAGALSAPGLAAGGAASSTTTTPTGEMGGGASEQLHEDDVGGMLEQLLDLADAAHAQHEQQQHEQQQQQQLHLHQQHQPNHNTHPYT
ncbi:hypothetical protein BDZ88DRAFT_431217 [Geranomyces variabilis]|nr:hypothetical protein BDZ88DRAFT_431217 [Geranomyces variabilis]